MHCSTSTRIVPSRVTVPYSRQIDVCVMQDVCRYVQSDTVHAFRRRTCHSRNVVYHRIGKSVKKDYRLLQIHEVWHFPQKSGMLFKEYIDTFAKIKLEASGYPKNCVTDKQKQAYLDDILEHQGIQVDPAKIVYNPGLRLWPSSC